MAGNVSNISFHASTFVQVWLFTIFHRTFLPVCLIYPALWPPLLHNLLPCVRGTFCSKASPRIYTRTDHRPMATRVWDDLLCQTFSTCNTVWYFIKKKMMQRYPFLPPQQWKWMQLVLLPEKVPCCYQWLGTKPLLYSWRLLNAQRHLASCTGAAGWGSTSCVVAFAISAYVGAKTLASGLLSQTPAHKGRRMASLFSHALIKVIYGAPAFAQRWIYLRRNLRYAARVLCHKFSMWLGEL